MSIRDTRRSQSATIFDTFRKEKDSTNHDNKPRSKRLREEDDSPAVLVSEASTATLIADNLTEDQHLLITPTFAERHKEQQSMKLNRLKDKNARYQSHRELLSQCIESKLIPKGLKLELEPTTGNHDQEFLDMWYSNLQEFSLTIMKGIVKFCDKTISETAGYITSNEKALKQNMKKEEFQKIKETISRNAEASKRVLKQRKFKKINYLKHKPDTERNQKTSQTRTVQDTLRPTYASILKNNTNIASNSIKQNTNPTGERPTLQQKLQSFTSKHSRSRSKSPTRKASKTNQQNQSNEIAALKAEIED